MSEPNEKVTITVRKDEADELGTSRCSCGHLDSLHNTHCCTFCLIMSCGCGQ